jgi:hypothetical protein
MAPAGRGRSTAAATPAPLSTATRPPPPQKQLGSAASFLASLPPPSAQAGAPPSSPERQSTAASFLSSVASLEERPAASAGPAGGVADAPSLAPPATQPAATDCLQSLAPAEAKEPAVVAAQQTASSFLQSLEPAVAAPAAVPAAAAGRSTYLQSFEPTDARTEAGNTEVGNEGRSAGSSGSQAFAAAAAGATGAQIAPQGASSFPASLSDAATGLPRERGAGVGDGVEGNGAGAAASTNKVALWSGNNETALATSNGEGAEAAGNSDGTVALGHVDRTAAAGSSERPAAATVPCMEIGLHALRFSAYQLSLLRSAGVTGVRASAEVVGAHAPLTTAEAEVGIEHAMPVAKGPLGSVVIELPLCWELPAEHSKEGEADPHPPSASQSPLGEASDLIAVRFPAGSSAAAALREALSSSDACVRISVTATFGADEYEEEEEEHEVIAVAQVGLRQLLSSRRDLERSPMGLLDRDGREVGSIVATVRALEVCEQVMAPWFARAVCDTVGGLGDAPAACGTGALTVRAVRGKSTLALLEGGVAGGIAGSIGAGKSLPPISPDDWWDHPPPAASASSSPPPELRREHLPIRLALSLGTLELSPIWAGDAGIQRIWVELDLVGISDVALRTGRVIQPAVGGGLLELGVRQSVPLYHHAAAARCVACAASSQAAAAAAAAVDTRMGDTAGGGSAVDAPWGQAGVIGRIRLLGMGRAGTQQLGLARVSLASLLAPGKEPDWVTLWPDAPNASMREPPKAPFVLPLEPFDQPNPLAREAYSSSAPGTPSRLMFGCRLEPPPPPIAPPPRPPPPQGASDAQVCLEMHSLRLKIPEAFRHLGHAPTAVATDPYAVSNGFGVAARAAVHTLWLSVRFPGVAAPLESGRVRVASLIPSAEGAGTEDTLEPPIYTPGAVPSRAGLQPPAYPLPGAALSGASLQPPALSPGAAPSRTGQGHAGPPMAAEAGWSPTANLDSVQSIELETAETGLFLVLRDIITGSTSGGGSGGGGGGGGRGGVGRHGEMTGFSSRSGGGSGGGLSNSNPPPCIEVQLIGAGRKGHRLLGTCSLSLHERVFAGSDLVQSALLLRTPPASSSATPTPRGEPGDVVAEVVISLALLRALDVLRAAATTVRRSVGPPASLPFGSSRAPGPPIVVCVGQAALRMARVRELGTSMFWVEVDLRRACGLLLRCSAIRPTGALDFRLRELLYIADGSAQQRRLGGLILGGGAAADVTVTVYGQPPALGARGVYEPPAAGSTAAGVGSSAAPPPAPLEVGRAVFNLAEIHASGMEPGYEPRPLVDGRGERQGMVCVQILAREVLARAARASQRDAAAPAITICVEALHLDHSARQAMRSGAAGSLHAVWVEVSLRAAEHATPPLRTRRLQVRLSSAIPHVASEPGLELFIFDFRERLSLPSGSSLRSAVQRCVTAGGEGAELHFCLMGSSVAADVAAIAAGGGATPSLASAAEEVRLAVARLPLYELLEAPGPAIEIQLSLLGHNAQSFGMLSVCVGGRDAVASLQRLPAIPTDELPTSEALAHAACRADTEEMSKCLAAGADVRTADAWGQTPLHWAAASGSVTAVDLLVRAGASPNAANLAGMTPLHWAAAWGHVAAAAALLEAGADKNARDVGGATPAARTLTLSRAPPAGARAALGAMLGERDAAASYIQRRIRGNAARRPPLPTAARGTATAKPQPTPASRRRRPAVDKLKPIAASGGRMPRRGTAAASVLLQTTARRRG